MCAISIREKSTPTSLCPLLMTLRRASKIVNSEEIFRAHYKELIIKSAKICIQRLFCCCLCGECRITIVEFLISYSYSSTSSSCGLAYVVLNFSRVIDCTDIGSSTERFRLFYLEFSFFDFCQRVTYIQITLFFFGDVLDISDLSNLWLFHADHNSIDHNPKRVEIKKKRSGISISIDFFNVLFSDISRLLPFLHRPSEKVLCGAHTIAREQKNPVVVIRMRARD